MNKRNLPKNRQLKKLGDIAKVQAGGTPSRSKSEYWKGNIPWLKSGELNDNFFVSKNSEYITQTGLENSSAKLFPKGTLLMAMYGATAGKLGVLGIEASTNQAVCSIQNINGLFDNKYIFHFLWVNRSKIIKDSFGGAQPNISKSYIDNIQIPLPPLATQKAIVAKLDEIFANLDQTKTEIQKSIDAVDEVWKSSLNKVFEEGDWETKELGEVSDFQNGFAFKSKEFNDVGNGIQVLRIGNVLNLNKNPVYIESKQEFDTYKLLEKDIVISLTGTRLKKDYLFASIIKKGDDYLNQRVGRIRCLSDLNFKYLFYYLGTDIFRDEIFQYETGTVNQGNISGKEIMRHRIPLPPLPKQKEIVAHLDQLSTQTKQLKQKYQSQLDHIEELRKSVLDQAFKGELI